MEFTPVRRMLACLLEPLFRCGSALGTALGRDRDGVEMVLRGKALGGKWNLRIGRGVRFVGPSRRFRLGKNVCLYGNSYLNANGPNGFVEIGEGSHVDVYCVLYGQGGLTVGKNCAIASGVLIYSQTNADALKDGTSVAQQPASYARVRIGDGCWLGAGVRIIPGVTLGNGCHVGAGAVVTSGLPSAACQPPSAVSRPTSPCFRSLRHRTPNASPATLGCEGAGHEEKKALQSGGAADCGADRAGPADACAVEHELPGQRELGQHAWSVWGQGAGAACFRHRPYQGRCHVALETPWSQSER